MTEMQIKYEAEDAEGIKYRMQDVYPVFQSNSTTPHLYLFTLDTEKLRISVFHDGRMKHYEYPAKAETVIKRSLTSCNGIKAFVELADFNKQHAGVDKAN